MQQASNTPDQTIDEIFLDAINEGWFLRSKQDYPSGFTGADVRKIQDKAKAQLKSLMETMIDSMIIGMPLPYRRVDDMNMVDLDALVSELAKRKAEVISKYFDGGKE